MQITAKMTPISDATLCQITVDIHAHRPFYDPLGFCPWLLRWASTKAKPIWIHWSKRQWVAVASSGPYANYCRHLSNFYCRNLNYSIEIWL